ncbi:hypothetical protein SPRG_11146 [Saprolegnia parasitica CBS 223.65]|uniref:Uncharacterized protein n=1 Tax=Saprolegnia parasitica (strain CBS 223.65) TaxID=695850 RepID=A0A067BXJ0_SAPPC|nr:hypothetical protein SPRG_11146 [Saprolegnia parasitica CBS 223.65]KDO23214.1 hypothetical protein SPRG_11146 [Saprolegnia parasitica CBS 223.65]|eukprot:XP_012206013.1 hypothetical protein SPRG_11146 [Saprolegnia parasitica CBS 223.65]
MAASVVLGSRQLLAIIVAHQSGLPEAIADIPRLTNAVTLAGYTEIKYLVNIPTRFASLPYLQRYRNPATMLLSHALFMATNRRSQKVDAALPLHLLVVEGNVAAVALWLRHKPGLVTSRTLELAAAASQGAVLRFLYERYPELATPTMMDLVAKAGDATLLRWLHDAGVSCTTAAMDGAAMNGHLDAVAFLHEARTEGCTKIAATAAVRNGHAAIVRFLLDHRTEGMDPYLRYSIPYIKYQTHSVRGTTHVDAVDAAMARSLLSSEAIQYLTKEKLGFHELQYFYSRGYCKMAKTLLEWAVTRHDNAMLAYVLNGIRAEHAPPDSDDEWLPSFGDWKNGKAIDLAAFYGDVAALELLHASRLQCASARAMAFASYNGHLHVLQWLHTHRQDGCSEDALALAAARGHLHVVRWLLEVFQVPMTQAALATAAYVGDLAIVTYLSKQPHVIETNRIGGLCRSFLPENGGALARGGGDYYSKCWCRLATLCGRKP